MTREFGLEYDGKICGVAVADLGWKWPGKRGDGALDLYVACTGGPSTTFVNMNQGQNFLRFKLIGTKSNRDAIGAKVFLYEAGHPGEKNYLLGLREVQASGGYFSMSSTIVHFGVKPNQKYDAQFIFPSKLIITVTDLLPGQTLTIYEESGITRHVSLFKRWLLRNLKTPRNYIETGHFLIFLLLVILAFFYSGRKLWGSRLSRILLSLPPVIVFLLVKWLTNDWNLGWNHGLPYLIGIAALALIAWINYYFSQQISRDERLSALLVACRSFEHSQWNSSCFNQLGLLFENIEPEKTISDEIKIYVMTAINNFYQFIYPEIKKIDELAIQVFNSEAGTEKLKNNVLKLSHLLDTAKIDVEIKGKINAIIQKKVPDLITHVQQILKLISTRVDQHFSTPLHEIINASIQNFRQPDIRIILEPPEMDTEVRIRLLRSDVKFIIENLFQNACRALQDQNDKQIKIQIQINQREVIMLFSDNGEGIPTEIKTHLFGDGISSRAGGKGGFGLFRTKTILYQYGGDIQIKESILSQGTTFELRFRRVQN